MYEMIEIHRYFCRVAANLVCCLSEASCKRKVRESAPCKNAVNGFRFSYTYLYLCFYEYSIHYRRTNQNFSIYSYNSKFVLSFFSSISTYSGNGSPCGHSPHRSTPMIFLSFKKNFKRSLSMRSDICP